MSDTKKKVAVIGGGVSGLAAAWHLIVNGDEQNQVDLYEASDRLGGHACTVPVNDDKKTEVDIGFMVFNHDNYPNMIRWFQHLGVQEEDSDMSLSVSLDQGRTVEWNSDGLPGLFAQPTQCLSPAFHSFVLEMLRFNKLAPELLLLHEDDPRKHVTVGQYLRENNYSESFCTYYLLPMMAALWSASLSDVLEFPAAQLIGFLCNHKMLQLFQRPTWKTVKGRSKQYTERMNQLFASSSLHAVHTSAAVTAVVKNTTNNKWDVYTSNPTVATSGQYDHIIFACHTDTAASILSNEVPGNYRKCDNGIMQLLSQIEYEDNAIYVHSDPSLMPSRRRAWASWNCLGKSHLLKQGLSLHSARKKAKEAMEGAASGFGNTMSTADHNPSAATGHGDALEIEGEQGRMKAVYVTYWLNRLQNLDTDTNIFVSLNPHHKPAEHLTYQRVIMAHPQFNPSTLKARKELLEKWQGVDGLWFCGAWEGYGFHEDGCRSGFNAACKLSGIPLPWADVSALVLPPPNLAIESTKKSWFANFYVKLTRDLPIAVAKRFIFHFLRQAIQKGRLELKMNDGSIAHFGDGTPCGVDREAVTMRIYDDWFFVKTALEYDLGLARSYMAGHFVIEPLEHIEDYHPVIKPKNSRDETNTVLGDPIGLTRLFLLLIGNRDRFTGVHIPRKSGLGRSYSNAMTNASGLVIAKIGSLLNYLRYKLTMDNSERGGSLKNIHAHYDLSNDLFTTFLDKETLMYSSAIYDAVTAPSPLKGLVFRGSLEEAQWRKLDTLLHRAQVQPGQTLLDIGFGWGGLSIHAAKTYGCRVTGITLSVEQKALAEKRVKVAGLGDLITFEVVDYRTFARRKENRGKFDRVLSCEMIEAVGHKHLGEFFWAVEQVLAHDGILVMEAITTPEQRYENYLRSTDFINSIIFPGSCCPSLHALVDAAYQQSCLTLEHIDNIGLHYAQTLAEWRRRFNANEETVRKLGFDGIFMRAWNYYLTYCEAGFFSQTENCLILVFARQGCASLAPLVETRSVTQARALTMEEIQNWVGDST